MGMVPRCHCSGVPFAVALGRKTFNRIAILSPEWDVKPWVTPSKKSDVPTGLEEAYAKVYGDRYVRFDVEGCVRYCCERRAITIISVMTLRISVSPNNQYFMEVVSLATVNEGICFFWGFPGFRSDFRRLRRRGCSNASLI